LLYLYCDFYRLAAPSSPSSRIFKKELSLSFDFCCGYFLLLMVLRIKIEVSVAFESLREVYMVLK
jgi:hypothetical protein